MTNQEQIDAWRKTGKQLTAKQAEEELEKIKRDLERGAK